MPIYEYQCSACGKTFEVIQKFADAPLTVHEGCGGTVERLLSASAFQLKGSGWYATDYPKKAPASEAKPAETKSAGNGDPKGDGKSQTKADSKPAPAESKTESKPPAATPKPD